MMQLRQQQVLFETQPLERRVLPLQQQIMLTQLLLLLQAQQQQKQEEQARPMAGLDRIAVDRLLTGELHAHCRVEVSDRHSSKESSAARYARFDLSSSR